MIIFIGAIQGDLLFIRSYLMQEKMMDVSGELDAEFEAYANSGDAGRNGENGVCSTIVTCDTLGCTFGCTPC